MKNVKLKISLLLLLVFSIGLNAQTKKVVTTKKALTNVKTTTKTVTKKQPRLQKLYLQI